MQFLEWRQSLKHQTSDKMQQKQVKTEIEHLRSVLKRMLCPMVSQHDDVMLLFSYGER